MVRFIVMLFFFMSLPAYAKMNCVDTINVEVNGLVCDFCARSLESVFVRQDEVSDIKVDLNEGNVVVILKSGQTIDDKLLTKLIHDSGYNVRDLSLIHI